MKFLASLVFYPLMFLRPLVFRLSRLMGGCFMSIAFFLLIVNLIADNFHNPIWAIIFPFGVAFAFFMVREWYDRLLLWLNPTGRDLILFRFE